MAFDRRELLKLFGIGSVVAPVIGGATMESARAKLIEVPHIEIQPPPAITGAESFMESFGSGNKMDVIIFLRDKKTGDVTRWENAAIITRASVNRIEITSPDSPYRQFMPGIVDCEMVLSGSPVVTHSRSV